MTSDPFAHDDAAYVLGALEPTDHAAFEAHLADCHDCQSRVAQARSTIALLGPRSELSDVDVVPPLPDTLLPALLRSARRAQRTRRASIATLAGLAAACLIALVVVVWPSRTSTGSGNVARPQAMVAVQASEVTATADLRPRAWGTEIDLHCKYAGSAGEAKWTYGLRVIDESGHAHPAGTWQIAPGQAIDFVGGTSVPRSDIATVQVTTSDGTPILQLTR